MTADTCVVGLLIWIDVVTFIYMKHDDLEMTAVIYNDLRHMTAVIYNDCRQVSNYQFSNQQLP